MENFIESSVQCWGCGVFDRLFRIVSDAAGAAYTDLTKICMLVFVVLVAFVIMNIVWQNIKGGESDPMHQKTIVPLVINSVLALTLLGSGLLLPRLVSQITFEPTAELTLTYTQAMTHMDNARVDELVEYTPSPMADTGFFRPQLRDSIIQIMKTTVTQFQSYIKVGFAIMDTALSVDALLGIGAFVKHVILLFVGFYLSYGFFKLFINFCFYFADIIVAMTFFAFLFPIGVTLVVFKGDGVPKWVSGLGNGIGASQVKNVISAIIGLASAVITYTVIMVIIAKFFTGAGTDANGLVELITTGRIFEADLDTENLENITIAGCVVMLYVINYLQGQIPQVASMIMKTFDVSADTKLSEGVAKQATDFVKSQASQAGRIVKNLVSAASSKGGSSGAGGTGAGTGGTGGASGSGGGTP